MKKRNRMIACVSGQQYYTRNLGWGFTKEKAAIGRQHCVHTSRKVKCLNTGEIFDSAKEAIVWCGLKNVANIRSACNGNLKQVGKHPETKEPLKWEYVM